MQSTKSVCPLCSLAYGETAVIASVYLHGAIRLRSAGSRISAGFPAQRSDACKLPAAETPLLMLCVAAWSPCATGMQK